MFGFVIDSCNFVSAGVSLKAVQMLQHFEHLVVPLVHAVRLIATKFDAHGFVADIIRCAAVLELPSSSLCHSL